MRRLRLALLGCAGLAGLAAAGCASSDEKLARELAAERAEGQSIVTAQEIHSRPLGSPHRAVMTLWRALQYTDSSTVAALAAPPPLRSELERFETGVVGWGAPTRSMKPRIVDIRRSGRRAIAALELVRLSQSGGEPVRQTTRVLEVGLIRVGADWRIRYDRLAQDLAALALR